MDKAFLARLNRMDVRELSKMKEQLHEEIEKAKSDPIRSLRDGIAGTPQDALVQKLAADMLRILRLGHQVAPRKLTYAELGDRYGVTGERVRRLFEKLLPIEAAETRRVS